MKVIIAVLVAVLGLLLGTIWIVESRREDRFCDPGNPAYRALQANHKAWLDHFAIGGQGFSISDSAKYRRPWVSFESSLEGTTSVLLVQVDEGTGYRPGQGEKGFFYSPTGAIPNDLFYPNGKTEIVPLEAGIFCYKIER